MPLVGQPLFGLYAIGCKPAPFSRGEGAQLSENGSTDMDVRYWAPANVRYSAFSGRRTLGHELCRKARNRTVPQHSSSGPC